MHRKSSQFVVMLVGCLLLTYQSVARDATNLDAGADAGMDSVRQQRASVRTRKVHGLIDVAPLSFLFSPDIEGFRVSRSDRNWHITEEIEGFASVTPMIRLGLQLSPHNRSMLGFTVGGGALVNDAFTAPIGMLDARWQFKIGRHAAIGPRLGLMYIGEMEWEGIADVSFDSTAGALLGLEFTVGGRIVEFAAAVGYCVLDDSDVETGGGWRPSSGSVDLSGVMVNLGARFRL